MSVGATATASPTSSPRARRGLPPSSRECPLRFLKGVLNVVTRDDVFEKFLDGHPLGTTLVTSLRNPLWRGGAMTHRRSPLHQLRDHLAVVAQVPQGRELFCDLTNAGLRPAGAVDLLGLLDPDRVTSALQRTELVEWLAQWAPDDEASAVTVLALLEPELAVIVGRLMRSGITTNEAEGETLVAAWEVVTGRSKAKGPARLETIWTRARTARASAGGARSRCCRSPRASTPRIRKATRPRAGPPCWRRPRRPGSSRRARWRSWRAPGWRGAPSPRWPRPSAWRPRRSTRTATGPRTRWRPSHAPTTARSPGR